MTKVLIQDMDQYNQKELANKYKSTSGTQSKIDKDELAGYLKQLDDNGYFIIENMLDKEQCKKIKDTVMQLFQHESGRNNFEGYKTQRL